MSKLIVPQWPIPQGVAACSSTRIGGVSMPPYDSLNLGAHCGDNPEHVEENRKRLFAAGNLPSKPVWLEQVHGKDVLKLTGGPYASKRADASYSNTPGTVCAVMTADCLPVLFCNRAGTEVAAAHAGWRGLCAGALEETVACFADEPENIIAWLGPAIGPNAFEVGAEVPAPQPVPWRPETTGWRAEESVRRSPARSAGFRHQKPAFHQGCRQKIPDARAWRIPQEKYQGYRPGGPFRLAA